MIAFCRAFQSQARHGDCLSRRPPQYCGELVGFASRQYHQDWRGTLLHRSRMGKHGDACGEPAAAAELITVQSSQQHRVFAGRLPSRRAIATQTAVGPIAVFYALFYVANQ
jgi:hypothetical protein